MSADFLPPGVGSIVHYAEVDAGGVVVCRAALVTATPDTGGEFDLSALVVFTEDGFRFLAGVPHGATPEHGAWHWPEWS